MEYPPSKIKPDLIEENLGWWIGKGSHTRNTSEGWVDLDHYVLFLITKNYCGKILCYPPLDEEIWKHSITEIKRFIWND